MMKRNSILIVIAAAAITTACGTMGKYQPIDKVDDNLYGKVANQTTSVAELSWKEFFTDPLLQEHITKALDNNLDLKVAYEHLLQAEATLTAAKLSFVPTLNLQGGLTAANDEATAFQASAISTWQLDIFRKATTLKSAKAAREQMEDYRQAVRSALISNVASSYYTLLMLDSQLAVTTGLEVTWIKSVNVVKSLMEAGMADQVAVSQYQATLAGITATRIELEKQITLTENAFNNLLSLNPGTKVSRTLLAAQTLPTEISAGVPAKLLTLRPDVRAAQRNVEMAYYANRNALLNYFPTINLSGSIGIGMLYSLGASIIEPVLNSGANRANLRRSESKQREARLDFEKTILTAGTEVCNAMAKYDGCNDKAEYYKMQVENLDKARLDTDYLMKNSFDKTYLDVLYAYNSYFSAVLELISNQAQKMQAAASLYSALGGGAI